MHNSQIETMIERLTKSIPLSSSNSISNPVEILAPSKKWCDAGGFILEGGGSSERSCSSAKTQCSTYLYNSNKATPQVLKK
jgi:hypothetical protein